MCRVILIDPSLDERWDAFVDRHPWGWVTHLSGWKRALERAFPHIKGHYLALVDDAGEIQAGLPLFEVRSRLTGNRLVSIPFATLCDALVTDGEQLHSLMLFARVLVYKLRVDYVELRTHHSSDLMYGQRLFSQRTYVSHYLDLAPPIEQIFVSFHRHGVRYMINKARRFPFELSLVRDSGGVKDFYKLYVCTRKRLGLPPQPYSFFQQLWENFGPEEKILFLLARLEGKTLGGLMLFRFKDRMSAEAIGLQESERGKGPHFYLFWEAIKLARENGCKVFDMGRTAVDNKGLMTFKSRWGMKIVELPQFFLYNGKAPISTRIFPSRTPGLRKVCSALPLPIFKALGKACYRHMG